MSAGAYMGPILEHDEEPWPPGWEQLPAANDPRHFHVWEEVLLEPGKRRGRLEAAVVRCVGCHCPRCGHSTDPNPCMARRHHEGEHVPLSVVQAFAANPGGTVSVDVGVGG